MDTTPLTREQLLDKPTWTVDDVCAWFDISRDTLERWRKRDRTLPGPRVLPGGRVLRWDPAEVVGWFDALERAA